MRLFSLEKRAFYRQLEVAPQLQALVHMGDFNHPDICWRNKQSRRFLEDTDDYFLRQVMENPTRRGVLLEHVLTNKERLVGDVKVEDSLGYHDHEIMELSIMLGRSRAIRSITTLDFRRANFSLFREFLGRILWEQAVEGRGVQESWLIFKAHLSRLKNGASPWARNRAKGPGDLHE